MLVIDPH